MSFFNVFPFLLNGRNPFYPFFDPVGMIGLINAARAVEGSPTVGWLNPILYSDRNG